MIFADQAEIARIGNDAVKAVFEAGCHGEEGIALAAAADRLQLQQPVVDRCLHIQPGLGDDLITGHQHGPAAFQCRRKGRFAAGTVELRQADIPFAEYAAETQGEIGVPLFGIAFIAGCAGADGQGRAQPSGTAGECALAEEGHEEGVEIAQGRLQAQIDHRLAQLVFAVRILDQVGLVDDIDQMPAFGHPPEHLVDADADIPAIAGIEVVELPDVAMAAGSVLRIEAQEGDEDHPLEGIALPCQGQFRLQDQ